MDRRASVGRGVYRVQVGNRVELGRGSVNSEEALIARRSTDEERRLQRPFAEIEDVR